MFRFDRLIENIRKISSCGNHVLYYSKDGAVYIDHKLVYQAKVGAGYGHIARYGYYLYGTPGDAYLGNFDTGLIIPNPKASPETISPVGAVLVKNMFYNPKINTVTSDIYYLNFTTQQETLLFKEIRGGFIFNYTDTKSIFNCLEVLSLYDLVTGECYWTIDLGGRTYVDIGEERPVTFTHIIGIEAGQLIVLMSNKELISIDIETGEILWETNNFVKNKLPQYSDYRMARSVFHYCVLENGKLYQLDGNLYYSLDLHTQEVEILWEDKTEEEYLTILYATYTEDYVYFTGSRNNRFSPYLIGAFNRKTLQVDWVHQPVGLVHPLTNTPHYVDGTLYILDSGGILHIFEKE